MASLRTGPSRTPWYFPQHFPSRCRPSAPQRRCRTHPPGKAHANSVRSSTCRRAARGRFFASQPTIPHLPPVCLRDSHRPTSPTSRDGHRAPPPSRSRHRHPGPPPTNVVVWPSPVGLPLPSHFNGDDKSGDLSHLSYCYLSDLLLQYRWTGISPATLTRSGTGYWVNEMQVCMMRSETRSLRISNTVCGRRSSDGYRSDYSERRRPGYQSTHTAQQSVPLLPQVRTSSSTRLR